ncbi:MAG: type II toxin-antitoxin system VapC family toxin [Candidatus Dormibacteria bacterium]
MSYLLDTNACIALINGRPTAVRRRFEEASQAAARISTSSVVTFELWYGVAKSARPEANADRLVTFLAGPVDVIDFDDDDAQAAGQVRASLEAAGTPIGAYDVLIGGQALRRGATLVTANTDEFRRIAGLSWEDWGA